MVLVADAGAMEAYGRELARGLLENGQARNFMALVLVGDLGAGKTTLMKGVCEGLEVAERDEVASPSYTLIHEYRRPGRTVYHLDLYRLETQAQFATLGLGDILRPEEGEFRLVAIEWGEKIEKDLARPYLRVEIGREQDERRRVTAVWIS